MGSGLGREAAGHAARHVEDQECCHLGRRSVGTEHGISCPGPVPKPAPWSDVVQWAFTRVAATETAAAEREAARERYRAALARDREQTAAGQAQTRAVLNDYEDDDLGALVAAFEERENGRPGSPLARYTVLPLVIDGRGQTALLCGRHDTVPMMLLPGTGVTGGPFPIDQRGLHVGMMVDAARRHEQEHHR